MLVVEIGISRRCVIDMPCVGDRSLLTELLEVFTLRMLTCNRARPLGENRRLSVAKGGKSDVESQDLDGLTPVSKY
jgi:hypothetical protein